MVQIFVAGDIAFRFLKYVENEESLRSFQLGSRFDIDVAKEASHNFKSFTLFEFLYQCN